MATLAAAALLAWSCARMDDEDERATSLLVSVAASLSDAIGEAAAQFHHRNPTIEVKLNIAGSGELARQIMNGAPVDIFLAADPRWIDAVVETGDADPLTRTAFAGNALALVTPPSAGAGPDSGGRINMISDLANENVKRIALGHPETVPAGAFARAELERAGIWQALESKLILAEHVRQAVAYVERGEVDAGFVYLTDITAAAREGNRDGAPALRVAQRFELPERTYEAVLIRIDADDSAHSLRRASAAEFIAFLASESGKAILRERGFVVD